MHGDRHLVVSAAPRIIGGGQHDAFTSPFVVRLYDASSAPSGSIGFCGLPAPTAAASGGAPNPWVRPSPRPSAYVDAADDPLAA